MREQARARPSMRNWFDFSCSCPAGAIGGELSQQRSFLCYCIGMPERLSIRLKNVRKGKKVAMTSDRSFANVIRERRRQLNLTQEKVALEIGTSVPYVGLLEAGKRHPSEKVVTKIADVLGLDARELFFLANPGAKTLVSPHTESSAASAWHAFSQDQNLRESHNITGEEMRLLSQVAMMGEVRSSRDFLFILNTIRQSLG